MKRNDYAWTDADLLDYARGISGVDFRLHGDDSVKAAIGNTKTTGHGGLANAVSIDRDGDAFTIKVKAVVAFTDRSRLAVDLLVKGVVEVRRDIGKRWPRYDCISVVGLRAA